MEEVPDSWSSILNIQYYKTIVEFQNAVKFHEETLIKMGPTVAPSVSQTQHLPNQAYTGSRFPYKKVNVNLVGWSSTLSKPQFPKDDKNVSKRRTPESIGARPCRHCGSGNHWDNECRHSRQGERQARVNLIQYNDEDSKAQDQYDALYYNLDSDNEDASNSTSQQDFCRPLQILDTPVQHINPSVMELNEESTLEGETNSYKIPKVDDAMGIESSNTQARSHEVTALPFNAFPSSTKKDLTSAQKIPLNRNSRRRLAQDIAQVHHTITDIGTFKAKPLIELKKFLARPLGCSFLGSKATQVPATINSLMSNLTKVIIDSGSDITLISQKFLQDLEKPPKNRQGQRINLVQVIGNALISGFVSLDLYFQTPEGSVKINVEAYVVKGMSTPFILGNDFADQYSISILQHDGETELEFRDSGRRMKIENSASPSLIDEHGQTFKVRIMHSFLGISSKKSTH
jgi:hypothetical protein